MKPILSATAALAFSLALLGCSDNGSSMQMTDNDTDTDADNSVDFTAFVIAEINNTSEGRDAVVINDIEFSFNDQNNAQAFTGLFQ